MTARSGEVYGSLAYGELANHSHYNPHDAQPVSFERKRFVKMIGKLVAGGWVSWLADAPDPTGSQYDGAGTLDIATISVD